MRLDCLAPFTLLITLFAAAPVGAADGYYLEEELIRSSPGQVPRREVAKTWLQDGNFRKEEGASGNVTIFLKETGVVWVLNRGARTYFVLDRTLMDGMGQANLATLIGGDEDPAEWLQKTGRKRRVGDWNAYEVQVEDKPLPGVRLSLWLSTEVPIDAAARDRFGGSMFGEQNPAAKLLAGLKSLEGFPVETELSIQYGARKMEMTQRLLKVEQREIPASLFALPEGFAEIANPFAALAGAAAPVAPAGSSAE